MTRPMAHGGAPGRDHGSLLGWLAAVLLVAVTLLVHGNTLSNGFVWDDETIIVRNPDTRDLSRLGRVLLSPDEKPPYYRPLNRATYLLDHQVFGMEPRGFHLVNVLLQIACVLALYWLGRRLFASRAPAFLAAALLAVHPIATEVVAFVTARNNLLALLFSLACLTLFIDADDRGSWARAWLSAIAFFLGLASKEPAAMVFPVLATWIALDDGPWKERLGRARLLVPHLALLIAYLILRAISLGGLVGTDGGATAHSTFLERAGMNFFTIPAYLGLVLFPRNLTIYHVVPEANGLALAASALAWIAMAWAAFWVLRGRSRAATVGLAWFAFGLLPIANLFSLPTATVLAERYFYIPAVGLWIIAADVFAALWQRSSRRGLVAGVAAVSLVLLGTRTFVRNRDWRDDLTLSRAAVDVEPRAPMAQYNLGMALQEAGDSPAARRHWEESARVDRVDGRALVALGKLAADRGDFPAAEAYFRKALGMLVGPVEARLNLGKLHDRMGDLPRARAEWEAVLRTDPLHADANAQLGALLAAQGDLRAAEKRFRAALRADPDMPEALFNLGRILEATGRPAEAVTAYERFLRVRGADFEEAGRHASQRLPILRQAPRP